MMKTETLRIYYNPRCSKCRGAAALAAEHGYATELIEYLRTPPCREELVALLRKLDMKPLALIRSGEDVFKQLYAGRELSDEQWLDAMLQHPVLIERPIVVRVDRAVVARPPEKMLALIGK